MGGGRPVIFGGSGVDSMGGGREGGGRTGSADSVGGGWEVGGRPGSSGADSAGGCEVPPPLLPHLKKGGLSGMGGSSVGWSDPGILGGTLDGGDSGSDGLGGSLGSFSSSSCGMGGLGLSASCGGLRAPPAFLRWLNGLHGKIIHKLPIAGT